MNPYETTATVAEQGQVHLAGVPFAPGTEVAVTITPKSQSAQEMAIPSKPTVGPGVGLRWEGDVLVHQGSGPSAEVNDLRAERLNRLGAG